MSVIERFYDLLFEVSNDYRHGILLQLKRKPMRVTELSKELNLTTQEISRHASRLGESGLIHKDVEGFYNLTYYGELINILLEEFRFVSKNRDYFIDHKITGVSPEYIKRMGELSESKRTDNVMEFLHFTDSIVKDAKEYVYLQVDQYPLTSLGSIVEALKRNVIFKVLEQSEVISGPHMNLDSLEEANAITKARNTSLSEQRKIDEEGVFMFLSEEKCAVAFPIKGNRFDYHGFIATDKRSLKWCEDLFQHYWNKSDPNLPSPEVVKKSTPILWKLERGVAIVEGRDSLTDAQAVQDAVNNSKDVLLKGSFNFGNSTVKISKSVLIRGEKGQNKMPSTRIYKKGWLFPSSDFSSVFEVNGENIDVIIENIHFTDFNCSCINGQRGKSLKIRNNRITLENGYGRGWIYDQFGDVVTGIWIDTPPELQNVVTNFPGGIVIEDNYLDFSNNPVESLANNLTQVSRHYDDNVQPGHAHQYYIGMGVNVLNMSGEIIIEKNTIKNMNARAISVTDNFTDAHIHIRGNVVESGISGSYPFNGDEAGLGILAQNGFLQDRPGFTVTIDNNSIKLMKTSYTGIKVLRNAKTASKLHNKESIVNNKIFLEDGQAGIEINNENTEITNNKITGKAFFGVHMHNLKSLDKIAVMNENGPIKINDISGLELKDIRWWIKRSRPVKVK